MKVRQLLEAKRKRTRIDVGDLEMLDVIIQKMMVAPGGIWLWLNPFQGKGPYFSKVDSVEMRSHDDNMPYAQSLRLAFKDYTDNQSWIEFTPVDNELPEIVVIDGKRVLQEPNGKPFEV